MNEHIQEYVVFIEQTRTELHPGRENKVDTRKLVRRYFPENISDLVFAIKGDLHKLKAENADRGIRVEAEVTGIYMSPKYEKIKIDID
ncbi:MAG: hypothetical protein ACE5J4_03410 [Candidatus Aenigmatarchaeota archaeon]